MASVRTGSARTSRYWSSPVAGLWRSAGGSLPSGVLQSRCYSNERLDGRVPPSQTPAGPLSGQFSPAIPATPTFGANRPGYDRNGYRQSRCAGLRVYRPIVKVSTTALKEAELPVRNRICPSTEDAQKSCHDSPRQRLGNRKELPIGSACAHGNIHIPSAGTISEAIAILKDRQEQGFSLDSYMLVEILKQCSMQRDLIATTQVHDVIIQSGMQKQRYVATTLLNAYIKCGRLQDARRVFDGLERSNQTLITWNVMIGAYAKSGCGTEAYRLFHQMKREGFIPDAYTYASILNPSAQAGALEWVKEVHGHARRQGLESDLRVGSALVQMYAKTGSIDDARLVFDRMEKRDVITWTKMIGAYAENGNIDAARLVFDGMEKRDVVAWNIMIGAYAEHGSGLEAYRLFLQMKRVGCRPNAVTYLSILNPSASVGALEWVTNVHSHFLEAGLQSDLRVDSAFVRMYAKSGSIVDARFVFDKMKKRDVVTWTMIIGAYAESGYGVEAYRLFLQMKREGFVPDAFTCASILNGAASGGDLEWVKEIHNHVLEAGLDSDLRVCSALVHMYAKSGSIADARLVFDRMEKRDVVTWTVMIGAYAESGYGVEAYKMFLQMKRESFVPDAFTYASILNVSASAGALEWVKEVHGHARKAGLDSDLRVGSALVQMYAKSGSIEDARLVYDIMEERDVLTSNVMIGAYASSGRGEDALRVFIQMKREGSKPDAYTYASILNASASARPLEWVRQVHSDVLKAGLESDLRVGTALVDVYAKGGTIDEGRLIFDKMEKRDSVTWNIMIGGLAQHGRGHEALEVFRKMNADFMKPDGITFVAVLSACCHAGLVDDGRRLFSAMKEDYGIEPTVLHYTCMADLLGRAGHLEEAKLLVDNMPVEPDAITWKSLLSACRTYCNLELGEIAAREVLKLEPNDAGAYVLLSNIYAEAGEWEKVSLVRTMMQERGVRKEPGRSWIEVDNKIHDFVAGDSSHPEAKAIYNELKKLTEQLKAKGYIPDTKRVLHNIDEEEKELALCSHSEKVAIAYGLLRVPRGNPILVKKNLRVCTDCHSATKLISEVTGRYIIVRDSNRFHHFKDGVCSCGDYW